VAVYRRTSRTRYVLAVLVLAALTLVTVDARSNGSGALSTVRSKVSDAFAPLQRGAHAALQPIGNFLTGAIDYGSLRQENQRLREEVAALQSQSVQAAADESSAEQVLAEQDLPFVGQIPTVTVNVIDNGSSNFEDTVTVGKGTTSGLAPGEPVVAAGGLVGSVQSVSAHTAVVVLLTDPSFAVGVRLQGTNIGTAQGVGRGDPLKVTVDTTSLPPPKMKVGAPVVTSGLNGESFPPNLPVGRVVSASTTPGEAEPTITIKPFVDVAQLSYLQVLLWSAT
jgi:rod shape-determining protein MreC